RRQAARAGTTAYGRDPTGSVKQPVAGRRREGDDRGTPRAGRRDPEPPRGRVDGVFLGGSNVKFAAEGRRERLPTGVTPGIIDDERIFLSGDERSPHFLVRQNPAFDPARVEEQRVTRAVLVPQVHVERKERILHGA